MHETETIITAQCASKKYKAKKTFRPEELKDLKYAMPVCTVCNRGMPLIVRKVETKRKKRN